MPTLEHLSAVAPVGPAPAPRMSWVTPLLDLLFPPFCPVCQSHLGEGRRDPLCGVCWGRIERIVGPQCRVCGLPLLRLASGTTGGGESRAYVCGGCRRRLPGFSYARSATHYGEVARQALHAFKFGGRRALAAPLGDLLAALYPVLPVDAPQVLVPVPLHPRRERERGFNQSVLLARRVGRAWGMPVREMVLARTVATQPQTELDAGARRDNVRRAFAVRRPELIAGRHVVLVDDVFTTGATAEACAACLKRAGAAVVGVVTVARAV